VADIVQTAASISEQIDSHLKQRACTIYYTCLVFRISTVST
jgi:hypothetical protein